MKKILAIMMTVCALFLAGCGSSPLEDIGMNEDQIKVAEKAFSDTSLGEIENVTESVQGENLYIVRTDKYDGIFIKQNDDKSLKYISYEGTGLWANGNVTGKDIADYYIDEGKYVEYQTKAEAAVKDRLKSPSTADFAAMPKIARNKDHVIVTGKVDAQNSFGATIQSVYMVEFRGENVVDVLIQ